MLRVPTLGPSRSFTIRKRLLKGVVFPVLVIGAVANAQDGAISPQREDSKLQMHPPNLNCQLQELPPFQKHPPPARRPLRRNFQQLS